MDDATEVGDANDNLANRSVVPLITIPDYSTLPSARLRTPMGVVAVVAVKIVGLYCLVLGLPLVYLIPLHAIQLVVERSFVGTIDVLVNLLDPVMYTVAGLLLIHRATWVATRVLRFEEPSGDPRTRGPGRQLQAVAFSVLGVWLVISGVSQIIASFVYASRDHLGTGRDVIDLVFDEERYGLALASVQIALGVWLFFSANRLAQFWSRLRSANPAQQPGRAD